MKCKSLLVLLAILMLAEPAMAYVLPADFIMRMLADKRRKLKLTDISIRFATELSDTAEPTEERLYIKQPERLRLAREGDTQPLYVEREDLVAINRDATLNRHLGPPINLLARLLAPGGKTLADRSERMLQVLQAAGIDTEMVALGRIDEKPVFIIGARTWEPHKPQLWIDKTTFLPMRYVVYSDKNAKGVQMETRLLDYGSAPTGNWFPNVIEEYQDGELIRRARAIDAKSNQSLPDTLFSIPKIP